MNPTPRSRSTLLFALLLAAPLASPVDAQTYWPDRHPNWERRDPAAAGTLFDLSDGLELHFTP